MGSTKLRKDFVKPRDDLAPGREDALNDTDLARDLRLAERKPSQILPSGSSSATCGTTEIPRRWRTHVTIDPMVSISATSLVTTPIREISVSIRFARGTELRKRTNGRVASISTGRGGSVCLNSFGRFAK